MACAPSAAAHLPLAAAGRFREALERYLRVEKEHPDRRDPCARARQGRADALHAMGRFEEALEVYISVEKDYPDHRWLGARARCVRGNTLRAMGRLEEALEVLKSVEKDWPDQRWECAGALLMAGAYCSDAADAKSLIEKAAAYPDQPRSSAPAEYLLGRISEAEFEKKMSDWHWRAEIEYWKGEKALRESVAAEGARKGGLERKAAGHFRKAVELNVPGEMWPLLEARMRLKDLEPAPAPAP
ncbi:MAG: tetratricopeptide repeat protein [Planctomycetota bacterium]|nr:tetratricopeptide repeat protein [Planctomycetota bacterium]